MGDSSSSTPLDFHALNSTCNNNSSILMNSNMELLNSISQQLENDQNFSSNNIHQQHGFLSLSSNDQNFSNHHQHELNIMSNFHNDHHMNNISHDVYDPAVAVAAAQFFTLGGPSYGCTSSIPESESMLNSSNNNINIPTPHPLVSGNTTSKVIINTNYVCFYYD